MKQLLSFMIKEFKHVFRDRKTLLMLFGLPTAQIILFGFALTNEIKNTKVGIVNYANDNASKELMQQIESSRYFDTYAILSSEKEIETHFRQNDFKVAVVIPANFEEDLKHSGKANVQVIADASDPNSGTTV